MFQQSREPLFVDWLSSGCQLDADYPTAWISSLYFDSPGLVHYDQKVGSDYSKFKVRLRWYTVEGETRRAGAVSCFLEVKRKIGSVRSKQRLAIELPPDALTNPLRSPEIDSVINEARALGYIGSGALVPAIIVRYRRRRFIDHRDDLRLSIDTNISGHSKNPLLFKRFDIALPVGVVEAKGTGTGRTLPSVLTPVRGFLHHAAFSKYANCCEQLMPA